MAEEVSKEFILENDLSMLKLKQIQFEIFTKQSAEFMNKLQMQITDLRSQLSSLEAKVKEIEARN